MKVQTENKAFLRDTHSKALLMNNRKDAEDYKLKSKLMKAANTRDEEINNLKAKVAEIDTIKNQLDEIKNLLKELVSK